MGLGETIKHLREKSNFTQDELGKRLNITKATVSKYEKGKLEPSIETIKALADIFDVPVDYLLGESNISALDDEKEQLADGIIQILIDMGELEPGEELSAEKREQLFERVKLAIKMSKL